MASIARLNQSVWLLIAQFHRRINAALLFVTAHDRAHLRMIAYAELFSARTSVDLGECNARHYPGLRRFPRHVEVLSSIEALNHLPMHI